jgi:hypothetical protein
MSSEESPEDKSKRLHEELEEIHFYDDNKDAIIEKFLKKASLINVYDPTAFLKDEETTSFLLSSDPGMSTTPPTQPYHATTRAYCEHQQHPLLLLHQLQ